MFCNWLTSGDVTQGAYAIDGNGVVTGINRAAAVSTYGTAYFLPTEDEWYKAAYYKGGGLNAGYWDHPTQDDDPNPPDGIDYAGDPQFDAVFDDGFIQSQPSIITNVGVASAYGTFGQGGNVWEWNETLIGPSRGVRGGVWLYGSGHLRASYRGWDNPGYNVVTIGFRVASNAVVPEPGCITALAGLAVMGAVMWRRRRK
jgi:formylglycine-generating enzyme required for sulfatase activity